MREWGDPDRSLGPTDPSSGSWDGAREPTDGDGSGCAGDWEDEFEPRFCVRCRKRIPVLLSERQDACDECLVVLESLARGLAPGAMPPGPGEMPACPNCGGRSVEREWRTDWVTRAVDVAADVATFFMRFDGNGVPLDAGSEVGPAKVMRYHCLQCEERWKPKR